MAERKVDAERQARLLVVEDDPRIAGVLVKGLHKQGYAAESVESGGGAIARIEAGDVDVMLLDLGLPDIDGLDVLRMLRERGSDLPVIVVTSRSDPRDRATAVELGVHTYLTKPFAWGDVWAAVRQCVVAHDQA
jgi:two-component system OmpR family response regulator